MKCKTQVNVHFGFASGHPVAPIPFADSAAAAQVCESAGSGGPERSRCSHSLPRKSKGRETSGGETRKEFVP